MFGLGFLGKMFGSDKAMDAMIGGVTKGLDALVYTKEEKAIDAAKERSEARSMVVGWMQATSGQNLARRFLALAITGTWLMGHVIAVGMAATAPWVQKVTADRLHGSSELVGTFVAEMNYPVMLILGFYFAAPHMGSMVGTVMNKWTGKK